MEKKKSPELNGEVLFCDARLVANSFHIRLCPGDGKKKKKKSSAAAAPAAAVFTALGGSRRIKFLKTKFCKKTVFDKRLANVEEKES